MKLNKVIAKKAVEYPSFNDYHSNRQSFLKRFTIGVVGLTAAVSYASAQDLAPKPPGPNPPAVEDHLKMLGEMMPVASPTPVPTPTPPPETTKIEGDLVVVAPPPVTRGRIRSVPPPKDQKSSGESK